MLLYDSESVEKVSFSALEVIVVAGEAEDERAARRPPSREPLRDRESDFDLEERELLESV